MTIWFCSDLHINHSRIIEYCSRPYESTKEMNKVLIDNWNSVVNPEDTVVVVGDMFMGSWKNICEIVPRLDGNIRLVKGNHDTSKRLEEMEKAGVIVEDNEVTIYDNGVDPIILAVHDPEYFADMSYFNIVDVLTELHVFVDGRDIIWVYGHVHDKAPVDIQKESFGVYSFHVGVDTNNYTPVSWDYIVEQYKNLKEKENEK